MPSTTPPDAQSRAPAGAAPAPAAPAGTPPPRGSRRRRLWELSTHALCPVIGVCLPIQVVRRLVDKALGGQTQASDYELHCGVNNVCRQRSPVAEAVQRELDRRFATAVRESQALKHPAALGAWWDQGQDGCEVAARFWAVLSHPQCDTALEERLLQDIHMLQHQSGVGARADLQRLEQLMHENQVLARELGAAQQRATQLSQTQARLCEGLQAELMRLRAQLLGRDTLIAELQEQVAQLQADSRQLPARQALAQRLQETQAQLRALTRLQHARQLVREQAPESAPAQGQGPAPLAAHAGVTAGLPSPVASVTPVALPGSLHQRAVLCVGGRTDSVPRYRHWVEQTGGRFLHHDGGEENNLQRLDSHLAAADLVICQTGCISHDAYWRVKDHCKRHGKPCMFVDTPSSSSLRRALSPWQAAPAAPPDPA